MGFWDKRLGGAQGAVATPTGPVAPMYPALPPLHPQAPTQPSQQAQITDVAAYKRDLAQALREKRITPEVAAAEWAKLGGGDGSRIEDGHCPECGDPRYFSRAVLRSQSSGLRRMTIPPAPMCMACGFQGDVIGWRQYGETHEALPEAPPMNGA